MAFAAARAVTPRGAPAAPDTAPARPLRLLMLSHAARDPDAGAAGTSLCTAAALREAGHEVTELFKDELLPLRPPGPIGEDLLAAAALRIAPAIVRRFDVVDASGFLGVGLFPLLAARRRRPLLIARSYGLEHADHEALMAEVRAGRARVSRRYRLRGGGAHLKAVEWAIRHGDGFTSPQHADGRRALQDGWRAEDREVLVNPHGVAREALLARREPQQPWTGRIAWCGTTVARKGWRDFVEGVSAALADQALTVDVLGSGTSAQLLLDDFPAQHRHRIRVHPRLPRAAQFAILARADVFVSTSLSEGFHLALLEAMAVGVPCIATRAGFLLGESRARQLALLIPQRSPRHVPDALRALAGDAGRRVALARAAREYARAHTWAHTAERYLRWLDTLPSPARDQAAAVSRPR
jgi:glycosyltransferase involved in cell wall biosynthesis